MFALGQRGDLIVGIPSKNRGAAGSDMTQHIASSILEITADAWVPALDQDGSERITAGGK